MTAERDRAQFTGYAGQNSPFRRGEGFPNLPLVDDDTIVEFNSDQAIFGTVFIDKALEFIEENRNGPFFAYIPLTAPHVPLHPDPSFLGTSDRGLYGDGVQEIDFGVGRILAKLVELGIDNETLVIFISDNGPYLAYGIDGGDAGILSGGKNEQWEGGIRVPALMRWPGQLAPATTVSEPASTVDILPTLAGLAGVNIPADRTIDGVDIWPFVSGQSQEPPHEALFSFRQSGLTSIDLGAIRSGGWKLHVSTTSGVANPVGLYDLLSDIGEVNDVRSNNPSIVANLLALGNSMITDIKNNQRPIGSVTLSGDPFSQQAGAGGGLISIEAEHYHERQARNGKDWQTISFRHSSADAAMQALPNTGTRLNSNYESNSPHLAYRINVKTPGRYFVWARGFATTPDDNSVHIGLDGEPIASGYRLSGLNDYWTWTSTLISGERSYVDISNLGVHDIDLWMREDGVIIDKILLTADPSFDPKGKGPVESQQTAPDPYLKFNTLTLNFNGREGSSSLPSQRVSLDTSDATNAAYSLTSSAPDWLTVEPASGNTPAETLTVSANPGGLTAAVYIGTISATADGYLSGAIDVTLTIITNNPPVTDDDSPFTTNEGERLSGNLDVLANDTDADGDALSAVLVAGPKNDDGNFVLNSDGTFSYTHNGSETTSDSFIYRPSDGILVGNAATVTIIINAVNDAPELVRAIGNQTVNVGISASVNVAGFFSDPEGDLLTFSASGLPAALTIAADGIISGTPASSDVGTYDVTITATDPSNESVSDTFTLTIAAAAPPTPPPARNGGGSASVFELFAAATLLVWFQAAARRRQSRVRVTVSRVKVIALPDSGNKRRCRRLVVG